MTNPTRPPAQDEDELSDLAVTGRAASVAWELALGRRLTNGEVQRMTGLGQSGAWLLMGRMSGAIPITFYEGYWQSTRVALDGFENNPPQR